MSYEKYQIMMNEQTANLRDLAVAFKSRNKHENKKTHATVALMKEKIIRMAVRLDNEVVEGQDVEYSREHIDKAMERMQFLEGEASISMIRKVKHMMGKSGLFPVSVPVR